MWPGSCLNVSCLRLPSKANLSLALYVGGRLFNGGTRTQNVTEDDRQADQIRCGSIRASTRWLTISTAAAAMSWRRSVGIRGVQNMELLACKLRLTVIWRCACCTRRIRKIANVDRLQMQSMYQCIHFHKRFTQLLFFHFSVYWMTCRLCVVSKDRID